MTQIPEPSGSLPTPKACLRLGKSPAALNKQCEQLGPEQLLGMSAAWALEGRTAARGAGWLAGEASGGSDSLLNIHRSADVWLPPPLRSPAPNEAELGNQGIYMQSEPGTFQRVQGCA